MGSFFRVHGEIEGYSPSNNITHSTDFKVNTDRMASQAIDYEDRVLSPSIRTSRYHLERIKTSIFGRNAVYCAEN
jgi:hypothetical protein